MKPELVYGENERVTKWMAERIGINSFRDDAVSIGIERNGELVGGAAFDTFSDRECVIHLASDGSKRWISREFIVSVFAYAFHQCYFRRLTAFVRASNAPSLKIVQQFGFKEEGRARCAGPDGEDLVMFGLLREECRYITPLIFAPTLG